MTREPRLDAGTVLTLAWAFAGAEVERLIVENWARDPQRDRLTWAAFDHALVWTPRMIEVAKQIIERTTIHAHDLEYAVSAIGTTQPDVAIGLLEAILRKELRAAKEESAKRVAAAPQGDGDEYWKWRIAASPREPITDVVERENVWDTLEALAAARPEPFLDALWPWFTEAMSALADLESDREGDPVNYFVRYTLDFKFAEEDAGRDRSGPPILGAIRVALETLARSDAERFLAWLAAHESEEFAPAQRLFAHVLSLSPQDYAERAHRFLTGDQRRFLLGNHEDRSGTSKRLVAASSPNWSDAEIAAFVALINAYAPPPYPNLDAEGRRHFQDTVRIIRLGLLSALPADRLPAESRRLVLEEQRRFPRSDRGVRRQGASWIGSPISAEQLRKARDEDIINAFREVPDKYDWDHPNRMIEGGNIQLSRAFAEFAKTDPQRAARLIRGFEPSFGTRGRGARPRT